MKKEYLICLDNKYKKNLELRVGYDPLFINFFELADIKVATCIGSITNKSAKKTDELLRIMYEFVPNENANYVLMVLHQYQRPQEFSKIKHFLLAQPEVKAVGWFYPPYQGCLDYDKVYGAFVYHKSLEDKKFDYNLI